MSDAAQRKTRRASPEFIAIVGLGLTILLAVLGQAAWLDGKIERLDARLTEQIESLDARLTGKIERLDARLTEQIESLDARLTEKIDSVEARLTEKIESVDIRLSAQIDGVDAKRGANFESLLAGQIEIRERLAALEAWAGLSGNVKAGGPGRVDSSP